MVEYLQKFSPLTEAQIKKIEEKVINADQYIYKIKDWACQGYSPEQIIHKIRKEVFNNKIK